jgi:hypothetical protein
VTAREGSSDDDASVGVGGVGEDGVVEDLEAGAEEEGMEGEGGEGGEGLVEGVEVPEEEEGVEEAALGIEEGTVGFLLRKVYVLLSNI